MSTGWIVLGVIVIIVLFAFGAYNRLVALSQRVSQAFADIDVQLKQRHDLIPNLVETVKGYASHERGTLDDVIKARNSAMSAQGPAQVGAAENQLSGALGRLIALSEAYPDLKANANFQQLGGRTLRPRKQDRGQPPLLQQRGPGIQHRHPAAARRVVRRHVRLHPQGILRPRRQPHRSRDRADREVLTLPIGRAAHHGRVWSLHAYLIEQVSFDAAARRAVSADLCRGLCRRAGRRSIFARRQVGRLLPDTGPARPDRGLSLRHDRRRAVDRDRLFLPPEHDRRRDRRRERDTATAAAAL